MRILHVTECYEGGVQRAMDTMVRLTPELQHFLIADGDLIRNRGAGYSDAVPMARGFSGRASQVNAVAEKFDVDVIHAHSSWAGVYARARTPTRPVVYEPHCFVFDDPNRKWIEKRAYRLAESIMGKKTAAVIALTPHERKLAEGIVPTERIVWLPNVPSVSVEPRREAVHNVVPEVIMVGRLARQKDPLFFAALNDSLKDKGVPAKFTWVGDGDSRYRTMLSERGVEVTGWLDDEELVKRLSNATIYFHSAAYEGFPLSVLDAAAIGLPILARRLPSFEGFPVTTAIDVDDAADKIAVYLNDVDVQGMYSKKTDQLLEMMTPQAQRSSLYQAYEIASGIKREINNCV